MTTSDPRTQSSPPPVVAIVQYAGQLDHFVGVDVALAAQSVRSIRINEWELDDLNHAGIGLVAVKDCESPLALAAIRWARRQGGGSGGGAGAGVPTLLLMDGVVEYRNTFVNPDAPERFLRPAPVDAVACAGEMDRAKLWSWGNVAVATGLPRIAAAFPRPLPAPADGCGKLLIATAKRPAFGVVERDRLIASLREVHAATEAGHWRGRVLWRLTVGLEDELGVSNDTRPLRECLAECSAVLTTPSTLLLEAMAAGRACGILHPQDGPLWQEAMGEWRREGSNSSVKLHELLHTLESPSSDHWRAQTRAFTRMYAPGMAGAACGPDAANSPAARVADVMVALLRGELGGGPGRKRELPRVERVVLGPSAEIARPSRIRRVVSCVSCDSTPIGGVMTWSLRMSREFAPRAGELGYEFRTLVVAMQLEGWRSDEFDPTTGPGVDLCVIDPMADHHERVETIRKALAALAPDIVLPNYNDACFMAAALIKPKGVRTVAIAHADDDYYKRLSATYDTWSAAVGVSAECVQWLVPLADGRAVEQIVYGVPVAAQLTRSQDETATMERAAMKLAYIGRMVEEQKRISDLLTLIDELEARSVPCELHMVGDGPDLAAWRSRAAHRQLTHVRVVIHGRRSPSWVEEFLPMMDACVLVSAYEGTSVVMLEAMGQGVVPVVTDVRSGVGEWVRDGQNGLVVPVGDMAGMAAKIAELHTDRVKLSKAKLNAWQSIRDSGLSIAATAAAYARVFDGAMSSPIYPHPTDTGLRPMDLWRWSKGAAAENSLEADAWCERSLRDAGYQAIAFDSPTSGCDAVLVRSSRVMPVSAAEIAAWRSEGLGVAVSPHLRQDGLAARALNIVRDAVSRGRSRIAIYPPGRHTRRIAEVLRPELWSHLDHSPFVGFLDDAARPGQRAFGLPVVRPQDAAEALAPDAVLLSSDTFEDQLWQRTALFREQGIEVIRMYAHGSQTSAKFVAPAVAYQEVKGVAHADSTR